MWTKHNMFEESVAVPLLISIPIERHGHARTQIIEQMDLFPTLTELCGSRRLTGIAGRDFSNLVSDKRYTHREFAYSEYWFCRNVFTETTDTSANHPSAWSAPPAGNSTTFLGSQRTLRRRQRSRRVPQPHRRYRPRRHRPRIDGVSRPSVYTIGSRMALQINGEYVDDSVIRQEAASMRPRYEEMMQEMDPIAREMQLRDWAKENVIERVLLRQVAVADAEPVPRRNR